MRIYAPTEEERKKLLSICISITNEIELKLKNHNLSFEEIIYCLATIKDSIADVLEIMGVQSHIANHEELEKRKEELKQKIKTMFE